MRKLVLGALLCGSLAMASGCIITTDDDDEPGGWFSMGWILTAGSGEITCAEAGAGGVSSLATLAGTQQGVEDIFNCEDGQGTTGFLPEGDYTVVVSILEEGTDAALGTSMPRSASIFDAETTDLGDFNFSFAASGDVDFIVDFGAASGSNCAGGAGGEVVEDQETTLTLLSSSQCISVPLLVNGTQDLADICSEFALCVESDVVQTLPDLPPDDYTLVIQGLFDTGSSSVACFSSADDFTVDGYTDLGTLIVPYDDTEDPTFCATI